MHDITQENPAQSVVIDDSLFMKYYSTNRLHPIFWKMSHGTEGTSNRLDDDYKYRLLTENKIAIHQATGVIGRPGGKNKRQSLVFQNEMKKGDYFYLCFGNKIILLGRLNSNEIVKNGEYLERSYRVIVKTTNDSSVRGSKYKWKPNAVSTCYPVPTSAYEEFENVILLPYFHCTVKDLEEMGNNVDPNNWWINAQPRFWSPSETKIGETIVYTSRSGEKQRLRKIAENFVNIKVGDSVLVYESSPVRCIDSLFKLIHKTPENDLTLVKVEEFDNKIFFDDIQRDEKLTNMEFLQNRIGTLYKLSKEEFDFLHELAQEESSPIQKPHVVTEEYSPKNFLNDVFMDEGTYQRIKDVLLNKQNIILQGAPGVGKTYIAKRLAYSILGKKEEEQIEFVQFHPNYSYEEFIQGYRPDEGNANFKLHDGIFKEFCAKASKNPNVKFFFLIDEINRGNMSKVFGELMMLIEKGYRGRKLKLSSSGQAFSVPKNLYMIGMMNTADRSLAMIDYALRRRFSFIKMSPAFNTHGFKEYKKALANSKFNRLIDAIVALNKEIRDDRSLGEGFCIGHSYFCGRKPETCTLEWMQQVIEYEILPMLEEYWFDNPSKFKTRKEKLLKVFDEQELQQ